MQQVSSGIHTHHNDQHNVTGMLLHVPDTSQICSFITGPLDPPLSITLYTEALAIVYAIFQDQALTHNTCVKCILHSSCLAYSAGFANLDGKLGTAHHFNDVEGRPADVIAQHLELQEQERKWIVRMLMISAHSIQHNTNRGLMIAGVRHS